MRIHDISVTVHDGMVIWPGLVPTRLTEHERIAKGDPVNVTNLSCCAHVGSHADAAFHHFADGETIEQVPLSRFVGPAYVADLTGVEWAIGAQDVARAVATARGFSILVLKTRNSTALETWERFSDRYVYIAPDGAEEIVRRGIKTVAFDHLAVEGYDAPGAPTHKILLGQGVTIVEGVDLNGIRPGHYWFSAAPMRLEGADGAPTRAYLIEKPPAAAHSHLELATSYWRAAAARDLDTILAHFTESATILTPTMTLTGLAGIRRYHEQMLESFDSVSLSVQNSVEQGDQLAVEWRAGSGSERAPREVRGCSVFTVRNGVFVRLGVYFNPADFE